MSENASSQRPKSVQPTKPTVSLRVKNSQKNSSSLLTCLADSGSGPNVIGKTRLQGLIEEGAEVAISNFKRPRLAKLADGRTTMTFHRFARLHAAKTEEGPFQPYTFLILADDARFEHGAILGWDTCSQYNILTLGIDPILIMDLTDEQRQ